MKTNRNAEAEANPGLDLPRRGQNNRVYSNRVRSNRVRSNHVHRANLNGRPRRHRVLILLQPLVLRFNRNARQRRDLRRLVLRFNNSVPPLPHRDLKPHALRLNRNARQRRDLRPLVLRLHRPHRYLKPRAL